MEMMERVERLEGVERMKMVGLDNWRRAQHEAWSRVGQVENLDNYKNDHYNQIMFVVHFHLLLYSCIFVVSYMWEFYSRKKTVQYDVNSRFCLMFIFAKMLI